MIHSARPTVSPVVNIVFSLCFVLLDFEKWGLTDGLTDRRTDGQHVRKQLSLPAEIASRPNGSKKQNQNNGKMGDKQDRGTEL